MSEQWEITADEAAKIIAKMGIMMEDAIKSYWAGMEEIVADLKENYPLCFDRDGNLRDDWLIIAAAYDKEA